jgi:acetyl/propionyl-CoA carboxylase alpha subunit
MKRALGECVIGGICSNHAYFQQVLDHPEFRAGRLHTLFLETMGRRIPEADSGMEIAAILAAVAQSIRRRGEQARIQTTDSRWLAEGRGRLFR